MHYVKSLGGHNTGDAVQHPADLSAMLDAFGSDPLRQGPVAQNARRVSAAMTPLSWTIERHANAVILALTGRVDRSNATVFASFLNEALVEEPALAVMDLAGLSSITSHGLHAFVVAQRKYGPAGTAIRLARPGELMREILCISRYDLLFEIAETVAQALDLPEE